MFEKTGARSQKAEGGNRKIVLLVQLVSLDRIYLPCEPIKQIKPTNQLDYNKVIRYALGSLSYWFTVYCLPIKGGLFDGTLFDDAD